MKFAAAATHGASAAAGKEVSVRALADEEMVAWRVRPAERQAESPAEPEEDEKKPEAGD